MNPQQADVFSENRKTHDIYALNHDQVASHIAKPACKLFYETLLADFLNRYVGSQKPVKILEMGCGTGNFASYFLSPALHRDLSSYTGIDISEEMVRAARKKNPSDKATFTASPVEEFFAGHAGKEGFDLIFSFSFIHHIFDLDTFFKNIHVLLKPGGVYIALHEPPVREIASEKLGIGEIADSLFAAVSGWDVPPEPLPKRLGNALHMVKAKFIKPAPTEVPAEPDLVDYQLSKSDFNASTLHQVAASHGLLVNTFFYSYYRSATLRKIFGSIKNEFAIICRRPE